MNETTYWLIFIPAIIALGVLMLMYLNGTFSYTDEIIEQRRYRVTKSNPFTGGGSEDYIIRFTIKRMWHSGKVTFKTKEVKA